MGGCTIDIPRIDAQDAQYGFSCPVDGTTYVDGWDLVEDDIKELPDWLIKKIKTRLEDRSEYSCYNDFASGFNSGLDWVLNLKKPGSRTFITTYEMDKELKLLIQSVSTNHTIISTAELVRVITEDPKKYPKVSDNLRQGSYKRSKQVVTSALTNLDGVQLHRKGKGKGVQTLWELLP
jgi:hypothetical protein